MTRIQETHTVVLCCETRDQSLIHREGKKPQINPETRRSHNESHRWFDSVTTHDQGPVNSYIKRKKTWFLGEFEGRWSTRRQGGEWGTDARDGARTGVSERLPYSPATTSTRCVWTQVHAGVVAICSDQPVRDRCVVFDFVARWKEGFMSMLNRTFARL